MTDLRAALKVWAEAPHPLIANAIEALSEKALVTWEAPKAKTKKAFHQAWLERAVKADAVTIGWLAQTLRTRLEVHDDQYGLLRPDYWQTRYSAWLERIKAIAPYANDPRVSSALCAVFEDMPFSVGDVQSTAPVYAPAASLLATSSDVRSIARLKKVLDAPTAAKQILRDVALELLPEVLETLAQVKTEPLDDEEAWRALDDRVVERVADAGSDEPKLLENVILNPKDDAARLVYADALTERGNPLGEFIALQVEGSPKSLKRSNALLKKHSASWFGPLSLVLKQPHFDRGFLVEAELAQNAAAVPEVWAEAARHPRLATVRRLHKGRGSTEHLYAFYAGGALRSLERIEVPTTEGLSAISTFKRTIRELVLSDRFGPGRVVDVAKIDAPIEALTFTMKDDDRIRWVHALQTTGLLQRLKRLQVNARSWPLTEVFDVLLDERLWVGTLESVQVAEAGRLRKIETGFAFDFGHFSAQLALIFLERFEGILAQIRCRGADLLSITEAQSLDAAAAERGLVIESIPEGSS